jgi:hypothetical protein
MAEACSNSRKLCAIPPVLLFQTFLFLSLSPRYIFIPPHSKCSPFQDTCPDPLPVYNITVVIAQLISVLNMEAASSSKTWVIVHESTLLHLLHFLHTNCNDSVFQCDCGGVHAFISGHLSNLIVRMK